MGYTNSSLVNYTKISPNRTRNRTHTIDTITIHCVVGQCAVETLGTLFAQSSRQASSNYGIGYDGRIGMFVEEKDRSWCTSSAANDQRAVTIEVASDTTEPYAVRTAAYNSLTKLVTDICRRNGIKQLKWSTSKNERVNHLNSCNMTVHRDYANKSCPGTWLYTRMGDIAATVNAALGSGGGVDPAPVYHYGVELPGKVHELSVGSYGPEVKTLQRILYARGLLGGTNPVDGDFGAATKAALIKLQGELGLTADGVAGEKTWPAMLTQLW